MDINIEQEKKTPLIYLNKDKKYPPYLWDKSGEKQ